MDFQVLHILRWRSMKHVRKQWIGVLMTLGVIGIGPSLAAQGSDQAALAKAAQNPVANMISVPFQNNTAFGWGAFDRTQNVLNIQPVVPITIGKNVNLDIRLRDGEHVRARRCQRDRVLLPGESGQADLGRRTRYLAEHGDR